MSKDKNTAQFGISIDPSAADPEEPFVRAKIADDSEIDLISLMDHPYNSRLFDTWTLLAALAARTERVQLMTNVLNLPLRPPAMLAKMATSLDVISNGRFQLGLGAGAVWDGIAAFGGPRREPGEAFQGFKDALSIIKGLWAHPGESFTYEGDIYQVRGAKLGPAPAHPIPIWVGAYGPRMLRLLGREADGWIISRNYQPPGNLPRFNRLIDESAAEAGRSPGEIRRGYNLMGVLKTGHAENDIPGLKEEYINGTPQDWIETLSHWYHEYRQDTFIFWPIAGDQRSQIEVFAQEIAPALKQSLV